MMVLHVYKEFFPTRSGVARHIDGLARDSRRFGIIPAVWTRTHDPAVSLPLAGGGWRGLWQAVRGAEAVHLHGGRMPLALLAGVMARLAGRPFVYTPHCYYDTGSRVKRIIKRLWDLTAERWLVRQAAATILLDDSWVADATRRGLRPCRIAVVPNCVLAAEVLARRPATPPPTLPGTPAIVGIGRLVAVKRFQDLITALADPALGAARLHLVGTGPDQQALARQAAELQVADRVIFHGGCDDTSATRLLLGAGVFALPSEMEGGPTAVIEALLLGCRVIGSDIPGTAAILRRVGAGRLVPVGDRAGWVQALLDPPSPPDSAALARLRQDFTWESRTADIVALYKAAIIKPL